MTSVGMVKVKLKDGTVTIDRYVVFDHDRHGKPRYYFRKKGRPKIRIRSEPGTEAFLREYRAALAGDIPEEATAPVAAGTAPQPQADGHADPESLRWLFDEYMRRSREWRTFGKTTQDRRRSVFDQICREARAADNPALVGGIRYKTLKARQMRVICDRCKTMATINARVKAFRCAFKWAVKDDLIDADPSRDLEYWREASDGFHTWTVEEVRQFAERHPLGTKAMLALALLLFTGQRRSDVVTFGRQHVRNGYISFTQFKGRKKKRHRLDLPVLPQLQAVIDASETGLLTFLQTKWKKPFTAAGFGNWFRDRCNEAGLPHCTAHGLRKAGATIAAEGGATTQQLKAMFGWDTLKQPEHYTRAAEQKKLATAGMPLLALPLSVPPLDDDAKGGTLRAQASETT